MRAKLIVVGGKADRKQIVLRLPAVVGRSRGAGLTIAHPMVSRQHCEIYESGGLLRIRDLGSTNGVHVAGRRVAEAVLRPHDQFSIGPLTFEVDYEYVGDTTVAEEQGYGAPVVSDRPPSEPSEAAWESTFPAEGQASDDSPGPAEGVWPVHPGDEGSASPAPNADAGGEPLENVGPVAGPTAGDDAGDQQPSGVAKPADLAPLSPPQALPAWEAPEDIAELDLEPSQPSEGPVLGSPPSLGFAVAPPDGELPDFRSWGEKPTTTVAGAIRSESNAEAPEAASGPNAWVSDQGTPPDDGGDFAGEPADPWPGFSFAQEPQPQATSPDEELNFEEPTGWSSTAHAPEIPSTKPKKKKRWWLFGKGKSGGTRQEDRPHKPECSQAGPEQGWVAGGPGNEHPRAESGLAATSDSTNGASGNPGIVDPARDESESDLDEFFKSLQ